MQYNAESKDIPLQVQPLNGAQHPTVNERSPLDPHRRGGFHHRKHSCCRKFWTAAFQPMSYFCIMYHILVQFPYMLFTFSWVLAWFTTICCTFMIFPIGPALIIFSIVSWKWLARAELVIQQMVTTPQTLSKYHTPTVCECVEGDHQPRTRAYEIMGEAAYYNCCSWNGFWATVKSLTFDLESWRPVAYFILVKPMISWFTFTYIICLFCTSLALIFNFVVVLVCPECYDVHMERGEWIITSTRGSLITIPLGLVLLTCTCFQAQGLAYMAGTISFKMLGKVREEAEEEVNHDGRTQGRSSNPDLPVGTHATNFGPLPPPPKPDDDVTPFFRPSSQPTMSYQHTVDL